MKIGGLDIANRKIGNAQVKEVRLGSQLIWSRDILSYQPYNIWDSEHVTVVGTTTTLLDYNEVGTALNMANPAAGNQPTLNASSSTFGNLPSLTFDGSNDYVENTILNYRSSDSSGIVISVFKLISGANLFLLTSADKDSNAYLFNQLISNNKFRLGTENNNVFNVHFGTDDIENQTPRIYSFGSDGSNHKFFNNEIPDDLLSSSSPGEWLSSISNRDNISIGAQLRSGVSYANIEWAFTGYFPYVDSSTTIKIIEILKDKYFGENYLLKEDGDDLLLETGDKIIL